MRTIVITGASDGIGAAAAEQLIDDSIRLILIGRSPEKTQAAAQRVGAEHYLADFTDLQQVRSLAATLNKACDRIDVLANNAGGVFYGPSHTVDGFEKTFQVNHLAHYLLTHLLIDKLLASNATVVNTASIGARVFGRLDWDDIQTCHPFRPSRAYGNAKLANILFTKGLHRTFGSHGLSSVAFHPGFIATNFAVESAVFFRNIYRGGTKLFLTPAHHGGSNLAYFMVGTPGVHWEPGTYYNERRRPSRTNRAAYDPQVIHRHWELSAKMLGVHW